ncbi:hypothetical protein IHQ56_02745 [Methylobacillus flagellatus]|uniref:hypothetical protein n=1 Tax=Methylobacillus flagellatus TaxID=405 RepID=UPI002853C293|nr:hypothetical protein [Methylobacillus flagellatus]MDR5170728.1 hypothetical protein [Methylobacillus flagellatus]
MQLGFGTGILTAIPQLDAAGATIANGTPVQFGTMQEVTGDLSFEEKSLYGSGQFPIAVGRGKGKLTFKCKLAEIKAAILGDLFFGTAAEPGSRQAVNNFSATLDDEAPYAVTVTPPSSGTFLTDLGVRDGVTGLALTKVAITDTVAAGEYQVSAAGVYTFHSTMAEKRVLISYEYSSTGGSTIVISNQLMGEAPFFSVQLMSRYKGKHLTLSLNSCTSNKFSLPFKSDDFFIPDFEFSAMADDAGIVGYLSLAE